MTENTTHGCALVLGRTGLLITGPSGSGKSTLATHLISHWLGLGRHAAWVGDDRIVLKTMGERMVAHCPAPLAGLAEFAHIGILAVKHQASAQIDCEIRLRPQETLERMPDFENTRLRKDDASVLPALDVPQANSALAVHLVLAWLEQGDFN